MNQTSDNSLLNINNNYNNIDNVNNQDLFSHNNNFMKKDPNKEAFILGKLTEEVEHIKNYCNELQRQFDNHCLIKNEKKEFENIKKENIKLTAEVSILKDDVAELMKKFSLINNKIDSMQQENNNLRMQNKNLLNFISIMNNSSSGGLKKFKTFNMNQTSDNSLLNINNNYNNIDNVNNQDLFSHNNNESMNIINLINNNRSNNRSNTYMDLNNNNNIKRNSNVNSINNNINNSNKNISYMSNTNYNFHNNNPNNNLINNLNSDQIDFSISKSMSKNFDKIQIQDQIKDKNYLTYDNFENRNNYMNINSNTITNNQNNIQTQYKTIGNMGQGNKNMGDNATDIASLIQSNFNLTKQVRNESNNKNKQNRYLIPKSED
jgi:predicted nuclease with TOPRIM domain